MATLSRVNNFTAGTPAVADDVDADFNQLVNALNGTKTDVRYIIKSADASNAALEVDNTGGGPILDLKAGGSLLARITNAGVLDLDIADGTAPIQVDSTTKVANLNADRVDDLEANKIFGSVHITAGEFGNADANATLEPWSNAGQGLRWQLPSGSESTLRGTAVWPLLSTGDAFTCKLILAGDGSASAGADLEIRLTRILDGAVTVANKTWTETVTVPATDEEIEVHSFSGTQAAGGTNDTGLIGLSIKRDASDAYTGTVYIYGLILEF